jgi:hypothetical protein
MTLGGAHMLSKRDLLLYVEIHIDNVSLPVEGVGGLSFFEFDKQ